MGRVEGVNDLECMECDGTMRVLDTRTYAGEVYRRRQCKTCGKTVWTVEVECTESERAELFKFLHKLRNDRRYDHEQIDNV